MQPEQTAWPVVSGPVPPLVEAHSPRQETGPDLAGALRPGATVVLGPGIDPPITAWRAGGTGKTLLAAALARGILARGEIDLLVWAPAGSRESIISSYARAQADVSARSPSGPSSGLSSGPPAAGEADAAAGRFLTWLAQTGARWLVVLDDLADPADAAGLWPRGRTGRVLVTTEQDTLGDAPDRRIIPVGAFSQREAMAYLTARLSGDPYRSTGAIDLALDLECLPLSLAYAVAYLLDTGKDCRAYRQAFGERRQRLAGGPVEAAAASFVVTWLLALDRASELPPVAQAWPALILASMFGPTGIPGAVLTSQAACSYVTGRDGGSPGDKTSVRAALANLARLGLVVIDPGDTARTVRMHGLLQATVRHAIGPAELERVALIAADAVSQAWPASDAGATAQALAAVTGQTELEQALRDCAASISRFAGRALWEADGHPLLLRAGESLTRAGLARSAVGYWQEVIETSKRTLGTVHPLTLGFRDHLAEAYEAAGRVNDAIGLRERALADREAAYGIVHPETVAARTALANDYRQAGRGGEATRLYERALADRERAAGPDHFETLTARGNLGHAYLMAGRVDDAIASYSRNLTDVLRLRGADDPETLAARASLAAAYGLAKQPRQAVPLYEQVVADRERLQGRDHEDTLTARRDLALAYQASRRYPDSIRLCERMLADRERITGPEHPDTLAATAELALAYQVGGRAKDALGVLDAAVSGYERALGSDHPLTESARALRQRYLDGKFARESAIRIPPP